jgi:hypothetical protein
MNERKEKTVVSENESQNEKSRLRMLQDRFLRLPAWLIVSILSISLLVIFCLIPFLLIDTFNQWCNLFPGFFNAMSPGICP